MNKDNYQEKLFGKGLNSVNLAALEKATGIPKRTLFEYREFPEKIPFARLILIVRAVGINPEELF